MPASESVSRQLQQLRSLRDSHLEVGKEMTKNTDFFPMDILALTVLQRSLHLIYGFASLIESQNFIAAAPLLRLQIDNGIRFAAGWLVEQPHDFAMKVWEGTPVRKMKTRKGEFMTDKHLVDTLSADYPWLPSVYENTSGYVHLSEKHIFNSMQTKDSRFQMVISEIDSFVSDDHYLEAAEAFEHATQIVLRYCNRWAFTKTILISFSKGPMMLPDVIPLNIPRGHHRLPQA